MIPDRISWQEGFMAGSADAARRIFAATFSTIEGASGYSTDLMVESAMEVAEIEVHRKWRNRRRRR